MWTIRHEFLPNKQRSRWDFEAENNFETRSKQSNLKQYLKNATDESRFRGGVERVLRKSRPSFSWKSRLWWVGELGPEILSDLCFHEYREARIDR